jgi:hypothetical protein
MYTTSMYRAALLACFMLLAVPAPAQTNGSINSTRQAYGVRLNAPAQPNSLNVARGSYRVNSRVNSRLSTRIERYRTGQAFDPVAALRVAEDDRTRVAPVIAPPQPQQVLDDPE